MTETDFTAAFEEAAPQLLQVAYDFVQHDDRVETIWIVLTQEAGMGVTSAFYRVGGKIIGHNEVVGLIPSATEDDHDRCLNDLADLSWAFAEVDDAVMPRRTVIRYDVADQAMNAEFSFEVVNPEEGEISDGQVMHLWGERLKQTGDDSADLVLTPEQLTP